MILHLISIYILYVIICYALVGIGSLFDTKPTYKAPVAKPVKPSKYIDLVDGKVKDTD